MKTITISKKALVMSLLKDHLVSYKLIKGLERLGLDAINFDINLGDTVFSLMGFGSSDDEEKLFEEFLGWSEKVLLIDFTVLQTEALEELTDDIYRRLKKEQKLRKLR